MTPPPATKTLTEAETAALFSGTLAAPRATATSRITERDYVARYDRCSNCRDLTPCLLTFQGETEWRDVIPLDDPLRGEVRRLRKLTGRRTVLLCSTCVVELRSPSPATVVDVETARLFEP